MSTRSIQVHECDFCRTLEINNDEVANTWETINHGMIACNHCRVMIGRLAIECGIDHDGLTNGHLIVNFDAPLTFGQMCQGVIDAMVFLGAIRPIRQERY